METQREEQRGLSFLADIASGCQGDAPCCTVRLSASSTPRISLSLEGREPSTHMGRDKSRPHRMVTV